MSPATGGSGSPGETTNVMAFEDLETIFMLRPDSSNEQNISVNEPLYVPRGLKE